MALTAHARSRDVCRRGGARLEVVDQPVGRGVVRDDLAWRCDLGQNLLGELLAELDAPLVKRVDVPDDALAKDLMLVHGDERAEAPGRQLVEHDRVGRLVAWEDLVWCEEGNLVGAHALLAQLGGSALCPGG